MGGLSVAEAQFAYTEDFTNTTAAGWNFYTGDQGPGVRLTSGTSPTSADPEFGNSYIDASGQGWLRLTSGNDQYQANAAYFDTPIPSTGNRVSITFNANMWGGNNLDGTGADGLVFFLYDASQAFSPGANGGSLGYAQKTGDPGLGGGYMGVALDVFGNFSNPTEGREGGVGFVPNAVVVRGPGEGEVGYNYLAGTSGSSGPAGVDYTDSGSPTTQDVGDATVGALPYALGSPTDTARPNQATEYRKVEVVLDENSQLTIRMQFGEDGLWYDVLNVDYSSFVRPEQLRIGFSAGTGGGTMVYEVGGLLSIDATAGTGNFLWDNDEGPANQIWGTSATNPLNWYGNTNPTLKSNVILNSAYISSAQNIDLQGSDKVIKNLYLAGPNAYSLYTTENRRLIFDSDTVGGLTTISLTNDIAGNSAHTIGVDILQNKTLDINNNISPTFTISGGIDTNGNALNLKGVGTTVLSGAISGGGTLTKSGTGTARLTGTNTYSGTTIISAGTLEAGSAAALGSTAAGTTVTSGGTLALTGGTTFAAEGLSLAGTGASGVGALRNLSGNNTWTGTVALADDATVATESGTTLTVSGVVSGVAANDLTKTGTGTLALTGTNTYTGKTIINAGTLAISNENNLGANPATFAADQLTLNGGTLRSQTNAVVIDDANRGVTIGAGGGTLDTNSNLTIATVVAGSGTLNKTGSSTLTLSGANTHSGAVNINAGTLTATGGSAIGNTSAVTVSSGATFNTSANNETIGSLAGAGTTSLGANTLTLGGNNTSTAYSGVASGTGGITKTGTGNFTLSGANTFTGTTTISAGTVTLGASNVFADTSTLALSGGTLAVGGNFSDTLGRLTLTANSNLDFNSATSNLTFTNANRTGGTLTIDNWAGQAYGGGNSQLKFTNSPTGFSTGTNGEYTQIQFTDWGTGSIRLSTGEIVPYTGGTVYTYAVNGASNWNVDNSWLDGTGTDPTADPGDYARNIGDTAILGSKITAPTTITVTAANRTLGYLIANNANRYTITGNSLLFDVSSGQAQIVNQGAGGLTINSALNLNDSLVLTQTGSGTVNTAGIAGTNRNLTFTGNGTGAVTVGGVIATGTGTLTKNGTSTLVLSGANTFTGAVSINEGTVSVGDVANSGASSHLGAGTTINLGSTGKTATLRFTGASDSTNRPLVIAGTGIVDVTTTGTTLTESGVVSGSGILQKEGTGTLALTGTNTHTGGVNINAGTLAVTNGSAIGNSSAVTVATGGTLALNSSETIGSLEGAGATTLGATTLTTGGNNASTGYTGIISGTGGALTKNGTGTFTLSGANTYTGATTVSTGTLVAASNTALGTSAAGTTVASGATLGLQGGISIGTEALNISGTGDGSNGVLRNLSGNNTANGAVTVTATSTIQSDAGTLTLGGAINGSAASRALTFTGAGNTASTGNIGGNISTLTKTGSGTLSLSGANTYSGATTVSAGTLVAGSASALGAVGGGTTVANGATLSLSNVTGVTLAESALTLTGQGVGAQGALQNLVGNNTVSGTIALGGETYVGVNSSTTLTSTGVVSGGFGLTKIGTGTLVLNGANTYTGTTAVNAGTLEVKHSTGLGTTGSPTTVASGATLAFNGASLNVGENIALVGSGVSSAGALQTTGGSGTTTLTGTITMNANSVIGTGTGTSLRQTGVLGEESGADYNLTKTGAGTLTLAGANTYNGTTTVRAGTLQIEANAPVSGNGALGNASSAVVVGDAGSGSSDISLLAGVSTGGVTIGRAVSVANQGGTITLGGTNTSGINTFSGAVTLSKNVTLTAATGGEVDFTGVISGPAVITKTGTGTVLLAGANTYTGATNINAGTVIAANNTALGTTAAGTTVASGATLGLQNNITIASGESITVSGTGFGGGGAISNISGNNTIAGPVTLGAATTFGSTSGTLTSSGVISGAYNLTTAGAGNLTLTGTNTNSGTLTIGGTGTTTLANASGQAFGNVTGVTVNAGATLALGGANQINDAANLTLAGGTFNVGSFSETLNRLTVSSSSSINYLDDGSALKFNGGGTVNGLNGITGTLSIDNWAGSLSGGGTEQLIVRSTTNIAGTTITGINFSDWGTGNNNTVIALGSNLYEIVPLITGVQWNNDSATSQNWTTGGNWSPASDPNATNAIAIFGNTVDSIPLNNNPIINVNGNVTVGKMIFENAANKNYTLEGTSRVTFDVTAGSAQIIVNDNGSHVIGNTGGNRTEDDLIITNNSNAAVGLDINSDLEFRNSNIGLTVNGTGTTRIDGEIDSRNGRSGHTLLKTGTGTLILSSTNSNYDGATTLRNGTLVLESSATNGSSGALGNNSTTVIVNDGSTTVGMNTALLLGANGVNLARNITVGSQGATTTLGGATSLGSGSATFSGAITLNKSVTLTADTGGTVTFSGQLIDGTGTTNITKTGAGTVVLTNAANNYDGQTDINAGTLRVTTNSAVPTGSAVTVASGAKFELGTAGATSGDVTIGSLAGAGTVDLPATAAGTTTLTTGGNNTSTTFSGLITDSGTSGSLALTKTGTGTFILTGANSYDGDTIVSQGTLLAANSAALGLTTGNTSVAAGATLALSNNITIAAGEDLSLTGGTSANSLYNYSGNNTYAGAVTLVNSANDVRLGAASGTTLTVTGNIGQSGGATGMIKTDIGTVVLSGTNSYTGATNIAGGTLVAASNTALGTSAAGTTVQVGATLGLQNNITITGESVVLNATNTPTTASIKNLSGSNTLAGAIAITGTVGSGAIIDTNTGSTLTASGNITQSSAENFLTKTGAGTLSLSGNNTYSGGTNINDGVLNAAAGTGAATGTGEIFIGDGIGAANSAVLRLSASNRIADTSNLTIRTDGQLNLQSYNETVGEIILNGSANGATNLDTITGTGTLTLGGTLTFNGVGANNAGISTNVALGASSRTLQVGNNGNNTDSDLVISGVVSGSGQTLRKTDLGTLELSGTSANTFNGGLQIDDGTVLLRKTAGVNAIGGGPVTVGNNVLGYDTARLQWGANNQLPDATAITMNTDGVIDLNGFSDTVGSVAGSGHIMIGTGQLIAGGDNTSTTFSGIMTGSDGGVFTKTGTGTLTLTSSDRNGGSISYGGEFNLNAGTLALDDINFTVDTLRLTGTSIIDFGGNSTLTVGTLIIELTGGQTLTITSWEEYMDYFYADAVQNGDGSEVPDFDVRGDAPLNHIVFAGWSGGNTKWQGWDHQVTPVPEPAAYGALLVGGLVGLVACRRRRRV